MDWRDATKIRLLADFDGSFFNEREEIIKVLSTFDWKEYLNCIAMRKIQQFHIVDVLKSNVDGIE